MSEVAIIGAGLAGLTAAARLAAAGRRVTVFEKSRGTGGRLATRRGPSGAFDHGAPVAEGDARFDAAMAALDALRCGTGWRGQPGMSGLVKPLAAGLDIRNGVRIVAAEHGPAWHLHAAGGDRLGPFGALILAVPAPQAAALAPAPELAGIVMAPRWTLMADWPGLGAPRRADPFEAVIVQSGRPGAAAGAVVAHATAQWSAAHLERPAEEVRDRLTVALAGISGAATPPRAAMTHRWRYALTAAPLGRSHIDAGRTCLIGGDWALGARAGDAWRSGCAMARAVLGKAGGTG